MMELKLLGGLRLDTSEGTPLGRAGQPRRLALLALLALARGRTLRRDQIVSLLWPERSAETGRHQLSSVLYDLRALLGEAAIEATGDAITLRLDQLDVDTLRFEAAVGAKRWSDAVALYSGDLLDGVNLEGSAELEQLVDERRARFTAEYAFALEREGERFHAIGEHERAIECWSRQAEVRPYQADVVLRLMRALGDRGDRPAALEQAARFTERLRRDLDAEPDSTVTSFAEELRRASGPEAARAPFALAQPSVPTADPLRTPRVRLAWLGVAALVTVALVGTLAGRNTHRGAPGGLIRLAVFPFAVVGDSQYRYLGDGMAKLLSSDLDGGGQLVTVSPAASIGAASREGPSPDLDRLRVAAGRLNADQFVTGIAIAKGDRLHLSAVMHSTADGTARPREVAVEGPAGELPRLVDSLASELLVAGTRPADRLIRIASATTRSIPALKEYLRGDRLFRDGAYAAAAAAFDRATQLDPTFSLAHYRCSLATLWADVPGTSTAEHDAQALRYSESLAPRDRELVLAYGAWRRGEWSEAERRYRALWSRYPDDAEAGFQLAETIFHYGPLIGRPADEARGLFMEVLRIDSTHRGAHWHLALLDGAPERRAELLEELPRLTRSASADVEVRGLALRARGLSLATDSSLRFAAPGQLWSLGWRLAVSLGDFAGAEAAFQLIIDEPAETRAGGFRGRGLVRLGRGQWKTAVGDLRAAQFVDGSPAALILDGILVNQILTLPPEEIAPLREDARRALRRMQATGGAMPAPQAKLVLAVGRLSLALHDSIGALAARNSLSRIGDTNAVHSLDAFLAASAGRVDEALKQLDAARRTVWFGLAVGDPYFGQQAERFLRAELLLKRGRLEEAQGWYGSFRSFSLDDLPYLARAEQRRAAILERLGRHADAVGSLEHAVGLWAEADSQVVPQAAAARLALARMKVGASSGPGQ